jgi:hypothetical protein
VSQGNGDRNDCRREEEHRPTAALLDRKPKRKANERADELADMSREEETKVA